MDLRIAKRKNDDDPPKKKTFDLTRFDSTLTLGRSKYRSKDLHHWKGWKNQGLKEKFLVPMVI